MLRWHIRLTEQLEADCALLESLRVMDYSLLLGIHYRGGHHLTPLTTDRVSNISQAPHVIQNKKVRRPLRSVSVGWHDDTAPSPVFTVNEGAVQP